MTVFVIPFSLLLFEKYNKRNRKAKLLLKQKNNKNYIRRVRLAFVYFLDFIYQKYNLFFLSDQFLCVRIPSESIIIVIAYYRGVNHFHTYMINQ